MFSLSDFGGEVTESIQALMLGLQAIPQVKSPKKGLIWITRLFLKEFGT